MTPPETAPAKIVGSFHRIVDKITGEDRVIPLMQGDVWKDQTAKEFSRSPEGQALLTACFWVNHVSRRHGLKTRLRFENIQKDESDFDGNPLRVTGVSYTVDLKPTGRDVVSLSKFKVFVQDLEETVLAHKDIVANEGGFSPPSWDDVINRAHDHLDTLTHAIRSKLISSESLTQQSKGL